jgi:hypothetical protein
LHGKLAWEVDEAGGVEVDAETCGGENVLLDPDVLADSQSDVPTVELERDRPVAGREASGLGSERCRGHAASAIDCLRFVRLPRMMSSDATADRRIVTGKLAVGASCV